MTDDLAGQITCPRCDAPIPDTAYVCTRCADVLAVALRHAASLWEDMETAVAKQSKMAGSSTPHGKRRPLEGPTCKTCLHDSCLPVGKSRRRTTWTEDPIPGETGIISISMFEQAWDVTNTATTWARLVEEESGRPIPPPAPPEPKRADPKRIIVRREPLRMIPSEHPERCDYSWLPIDTCRCGNPLAKHPEKELA